MASHTDEHKNYRARENTDSNNSLILFPFLAGQNESALVAYIYIHIHNMDHSSSWA